MQLKDPLTSLPPEAAINSDPLSVAPDTPSINFSRKDGDKQASRLP